MEESALNNYNSLQPKDQKKIFSILNNQLVENVSHQPNKPLQDFYNSVWDIFKDEKKKKNTRKRSKKDENTTTIKERVEDDYDPFDPFQIYVKSQSELRKDEFKNVPEKNKIKIFAHEWNRLTEAEKQRVIDENGRFGK